MKTKIVGICNVTPDSFSDGGRFYETDRAIEHVLAMYADGADIVDIGAESTRPGAEPIDCQEERRRLLPVLERLGESGLLDLVSVDTIHQNTANRVLELGVGMVNDVSGNIRIAETARRFNVLNDAAREYVVGCLHADTIAAAHTTHFPGDYARFVEHCHYLFYDLMDRRLVTEHLVLDPLIGFGKSPQLSEELLRFPEAFPQQKVMIGYSRKKFLGKHHLEPARNVEAGVIAMQAGAAYLRVHDVAEHVTARNELQGDNS